jgi:hypothetical protein
VQHLPPPPPPSSHHNGDAGGMEVAMEEDHLWPTKDGPLPIFLKVFCPILFSSVPCNSGMFYVLVGQSLIHPDLTLK